MKRDNNYIIRKDYEPNTFCYYRLSGEIGLKMIDNVLSNDELLEYISDVITHEHIHKALHELFNFTVSHLFDGIEYFFRNHALHEKQVRNRNLYNEHTKRFETYKTYIKKRGFNAFLRYYDLTQEDVIYANRICNNRLYNSKTDLI